MAKKQLFRSVVTVEILSESEYPDKISLENIVNDINNGEILSGLVSWKSQNHVVAGKEAAKQVLKHGTAYSFFCMDCNGDEEIEDEW